MVLGIVSVFTVKDSTKFKNCLGICETSSDYILIKSFDMETNIRQNGLPLLIGFCI